jgi:hypothetical protein
MKLQRALILGTICTLAVVSSVAVEAAGASAEVGPTATALAPSCSSAGTFQMVQGHLAPSLCDAPSVQGSAQRETSDAPVPCTPVKGFGINDQCPTWDQEYAPSNSLVACAGQNDPLAEAVTSSLVIITGFICNADSVDISTVAYDAASGQVRWSATYDGPAQETDAAWGVVASPDGSRVYVTGVQDSPAPYGGFFNTLLGETAELVTLAYDTSDGRLLWSDSYGDELGVSQGMQVRLSGDGERLYVTGATTLGFDDVNNVSILGAVTISYVPSTGQRDWVSVQSPPEGSNYLVPMSSAVQGQDIFSAANATLLKQGCEGCFAALNLHVEATATRDDRAAHTGDALWTHAYDPPAPQGAPYFQTINFYALGSSLAVAPGHVVVGGTGFIDVNDCADPSNGLCGTGLLLDLDPATGAQKWITFVRSPVVDGDSEGWFKAYGVSAAAAPNMVFITGNSRWAATTFAYDLATGQQKWAARYENPVYGWEAIGMGAAASPDGGTLYVTGNIGGGPVTPEQWPYGILAYDSRTGSLKWCAQWLSDTATDVEYDNAYLAGVSPDGSRVFASGTFQHYSSSTYVWGTVAYSNAIG